MTAIIIEELTRAVIPTALEVVKKKTNTKRKQLEKRQEKLDDDAEDSTFEHDA